MSISRTAAYDQVRKDLLDRIRLGTYPVGSPLPGRHTLTATYGVAYGTIDRAIRALVEQGVVRTQNGRGSFVISDRVGPPVSPARPVGGSVTIQSQPINRLTRPAKLGLVINSDPTLSSVYSALDRVIEAAFTGAGGSTWSVDRFPPGGGPYRPLGESIKSLIEAGVDATIVLGHDGPHTHGEIILSTPDVERIPTVLISGEFGGIAVPHVFSDNLNAGFVAASHLIASGYRHLAFLADRRADWLERRVEGVRQAGLRHRQPPVTVEVLRADPVPDQDPQHDAAYALAMAHAPILARGATTGRPAALVCGNDDAARRALDALSELGLRPGIDLGVIGFDDRPFSRTLGLSSVCPAIEEMGRSAVRMIVDRLNGDPSHFQICCASQAIARRSTDRQHPPRQKA